MKVIGTAGHIDHGKSTLVHRLTGIDPDRLSEEKQRGMTIDLGFAWLTLPSGAEVSVVDVPGHERFVKNMLAGAGGIDVALLVVAADEAVMPQTREHLDILDLLGVRHGVVALTKIDLVDAEWRELAAADVAEALVGTTLEGSPVVPVSAVSGEGIADLLTALDRAVAASPDREDRQLPYLPVDRVFTVAGFGTVATGTLHGGDLRVGQEVEVVPSMRRARIRALQSHRQQVDALGPGARAAVNLAGIAREQVVRGDVLALPGSVRPVRRVVAQVRVLRDAPFALQHGLTLSVHIGAAERTARLSLVDGDSLAPDQIGWAELRFTEPVAAVRGQRFILRLPAPARTVAGGAIVDVAPVIRRRDPRTRERLRGLSGSSLAGAVLASLATGKPRTAAQLAASAGVGVGALEEVLPALEGEGRVIRVGSSFLGKEAWDALVARAPALLEAYHAANPLRQGMPREELRSKLRWSQDLWPALLRHLGADGVIVEHGSVVAAPGHRGGTGARRAEVERVLAILRREPLSPPSGRELLAAAGTDDGLLAAMVQEGAIVRVGDGLFFARDAFEDMRSRILATIETEGDVSVARVRDVLGTTRKYALSVLEYLDSQRITRRVGDVRVLGSKAACG